MPAPSSSPIDPAIGHLIELAADAAREPPGLLGVLAGVADPRHRRGVRHRLAVILGLALCAVVAGARPFTAIAEWASDADEQTLSMLGLTGAVPLPGRPRRALRAHKRNQPGLHAQLASLPWRQVPVAHHSRERGHGRAEQRTLKITAVAAGLAFPHAAQAIAIVRRRKLPGKKKCSRETVYAITSLTAAQTRPAATDDHELLNDFAGALGRMRVIVAIASFTRGFATPSSDLPAEILIEPR
jgi:hypothetical protein